MKRTTKIILTSTGALLLVALAVTVKLMFFPTVKDAWFNTGPQRLRQVPGGLVILRPTRFAGSVTKPLPENQIGRVNGGGFRRMVGINVTFRQLMATAYSFDPARMYLPVSTPKNNFDFLVTVRSGPEEQLRRAILKKTGYIASVQTRDTDVLALKVQDTSLPGLKVADPGEKGNISPKNGRLYFQHMKLDVVTGGLEQMLKTPVVDETGLTNFYDFSVVWDSPMQQALQNGSLDAETGRQILAEWGLALEPETASIQMLVVQKSR